MSAATLKRVQARRKALARKHPGWGNATLLKEAWRLEKSGRKVAGVARKKKAAPKRKAPARVAGVTRIRPAEGMGAVRQNASEQRRILEGAIGEFMARQYFAKTKTEKRKIGKKIAQLKKQAHHASAIMKASHGKG